MIFRLLALVATLAFSVSSPAQTLSPQVGGRSGVPPYAFYAQPHAALGQWSQPICQLTAGATVNSDAKYCRSNPKAGVGINAVTLTGASTLALPANLPPSGGTGIMYLITHSGNDGPTLAPGFQYPGGVQPPVCNGAASPPVTSNCWSTTAGLTDWLDCLPTNAGTLGCNYILTNMAAVGSGFAVVAHSSGVGQTTATSSPGVDTRLANLLIVVATCTSAPMTITSSPANTFTQAVLGPTGNFYQAAIFYAAPSGLATSSTQTVSSTCNGSSSFATVQLIAVSGSAASPLDQTSSAIQSVNVTSIQNASITPTTNKQMLVTGFAAGSDAGGAVSIDGGFTISDQNLHGAGNNPSAAAYLIQTTAAAAAPTWSGWPTGVVAETVIASFKSQ